MSIDDFGTGYSSLAYLRQFPVGSLKINHAIVHDMTTNESNAMIVATVLHLAHGLGLRVVAEGVQNQNTCEGLTALVCDAAQGYYFGRPLPASEYLTGLFQPPHLCSTRP